MDSPSAIVVGSGVSGLAAAIRLAVKGYRVTVFEKNDYPGGKIGLLKKNGFSFDTGPSLFTEPENLEELFDMAGEPIKAYFEYEPVASSCKYFFANGKVVTAWSDKEKFFSEMEAQTGESPEALRNYLNDSERLYDTVGTIFLNHSLHRSKTWLSRLLIRALQSVKPSFLLQTLNQYHQKRFSTGEAIQLFNRFATYNGSNPYQAPAMLSVIPHVEFNKGIYYPKGGMISITQALYKLALKKGVQFQLNTPVQRIIQSGENAIGVVANNRNIFSDVVVSNVDITFTYRYLLQRPREAAKIQKREPSSSAVVFYWGIKKIFPQLQLHNIFFSGDYIHEFQELFQQRKDFRDPTVYINITSKLEPAHAPEGKENWFVMVNVPSGTDLNWHERVTVIRQQVLKKLRGMLKEDVEPLIETEEVLDPSDIAEQTNAWAGALYGTSSNSRMAAFKRPANFDRNIQGVFFCGGTVHPGGGIPLCFRSAAIVAELCEVPNHR